jgi:glycine/D-amino acid oxidase-like deaminating enzyme
MDRTTDYLIIGAGVIGTSVAFHLARRKPGRITLIDKGHVADGGSGRSSALIRMHYSFPPEVRLAVKSLEIFEGWKEIVGFPGDFRRTGFVRIVEPGEIERLRRNVAMQRECGADARVISREELKEIEPDWSVEDVPAAAYEPGSGYGDGAGVANDFLAAARDMGVQYLPQTRVLGLRAQGGRIQGVSTDKGAIDAPRVVAATGPWTRPLVREVGVDLPLETEYHEVIVLKNAPGMKPGGCACIDSITQTYFRSEGRDLTLVGAFYGPRGADPDAFPQAAGDDTAAGMVEAAARRLPALEEAGIARAITGVYDMSPDARPLMGEVPGVAGLHVAAGFSGMGFKISPAVGLTLSELILDGRSRTVDIADFRPGRFAEGKPIRAEHEYQAD